jgi:hypothetical protein
MGVIIFSVIVLFLIGVIIHEFKIKLPKIEISWSGNILNYLLIFIPIIGVVVTILIIGDLKDKDPLKNSGIERDPSAELLLMLLGQFIGFMLVMILTK